MYSSQFSVTRCTNPPVGYLEIINTQNVSIIFHEPVHKNDAYLTCINYVQDMFYYETFGCSYEAYITKRIDELSMNHFISDYTTGEYHQKVLRYVWSCDHSS